MKPNEVVEIDSLVRMIESEIKAEKITYFSEVESQLSKICDSSNALGPLILKQQVSSNRLVFTGSFFYSRFRPGDRVEIRTQKLNSDYSESFSYNWMVEDVYCPEPGILEIMISSNVPVILDDKTEYFLFKGLNTNFNQLLVKKLNDTKSIPSILGNELYALDFKNSSFKELYDNLNRPQRRAIEYLYDHNLSGAIQGPPGTGKTQLLQAIVKLAVNSNMKIAIASFTNAAVDNLLGRVIKNDSQYSWKRIANPEKVRTDMYPERIDLNAFISDKFLPNAGEIDLIGATLHKLVLNSKSPKFDLLLVDEAGQVPIYFWPFIQRVAKRVIMVGDQYQLPPVLKTPNVELPFDSVFSLVTGDDTPMLEIQYRMRKEIQAWSSEKFYRGKLEAHHSVADRDYFSESSVFGIDKFVAPKKFFSDVHGKYSRDEASFITDKVERLIKGGVDIRKIGVICPYRVQAGTVNASLQGRLGVEDASKVMVDTVERFQGQEKEAIFLSLGASGSDSNQLEFLSDSRRLNVSVTRAKSRFYCLFNSKLLENSREDKYDVLNEFLRWVEDGRTQIRRAA